MASIRRNSIKWINLIPSVLQMECLQSINTNMKNQDLRFKVKSSPRIINNGIVKIQDTKIKELLKSRFSDASIGQLIHCWL